MSTLLFVSLENLSVTVSHLSFVAKHSNNVWFFGVFFG